MPPPPSRPTEHVCRRTTTTTLIVEISAYAQGGCTKESDGLGGWSGTGCGWYAISERHSGIGTNTVEHTENRRYRSASYVPNHLPRRWVVSTISTILPMQAPRTLRTRSHPGVFDIQPAQLDLATGSIARTRSLQLAVDLQDPHWHASYGLYGSAHPRDAIPA